VSSLGRVGQGEGRRARVVAGGWEVHHGAEVLLKAGGTGAG